MKNDEIKDSIGMRGTPSDDKKNDALKLLQAVSLKTGTNENKELSETYNKLLELVANSQKNKSKKTPKSSLEQIILDTMKDILKLEELGTDESFFAAGGNSLLGIRFVSAMKNKGFGIKVSDLFVNETAEKLADFLKNSKEDQYVAIPEAEEKEYYLMSSAQRRMYLLWKMDKGGTAYNLPIALKLKGEIHPETVLEALRKIKERHEILRTAFMEKNGEPVQKILDARQVTDDFVVTEDASSNEEDLIKQFTKPFDLEKGETVRAELVKRPDGWLLMADMHHIVSDGMSSNNFVKEFTMLYNGKAVDAKPRQYKDYSEWMQTRDLSSQASYWKKQFSDEIPVLDFPTDFVRPSEQNFKGAETSKDLDRELSGRIRDVAKEAGATEYMVLLSAAMILLSKYSRQEDIVIGSPVSGRTHKDTEGMLGMFVNTLAMRGKPEGGKRYAEFLQEIKESCLKAYENQEYPFEELVEAVGVRRDTSRNPLFDVMLILQNNEQVQLKLDGAEIESGERDVSASKFDMTFEIWDVAGEYRVNLEYCTALYRPESMEMVLDHYEEVLRQVCENTGIYLSEIHTATAKEKNLILGQFNDRKAYYPKDKTLVELFEEQVARTPDSVAVGFEGKKMTYAEINGKANQLAARLRREGVKPNDFVAITCDRGFEMVIGLWGILKAGAAYMGLEEEYPEERIRYMMEDCKPKVLVHYHRNISKIKTDVPLIDLADKNIWCEEEKNLERVNIPSDLIYVIYTSGTTGRPKGILVRHDNIVHYAYDSEYGILNEAIKKGYRRVVGLANLTFDIHVTELILTLINGMEVYVADRRELDHTEDFEKLTVENKLEILQTTPSRIKMYMLDEKHKEYLKQYKYIMLGGEKVKNDLVRSIRKYGNAEIANVYGPSETTVWASSGIMPQEPDDENIVGKPVSNTVFYVMNGNQLCGIGVPGELCITGAGMTNGYLNLPELNQKVFVKNPFGEGIMFRSGDLVRWRADGSIQFIDRIDQQVKIRGHRIELGEIESVLLEQEEIVTCAVIAKEDGTGENAIYAYLVGDGVIDLAEIRKKLAKRLIEYMIPAYMMQIESIPVNKNGKLDKRALPNIEASSSITEYVAPTNETEEEICRLFAEILGLDKIGMTDDFFELGGHSVSVVKLNLELVNRGYHVEINDVFDNPTPQRLSKFILDKK